MYFTLFKARLKCLYKNPKILFWSFGFPILLAIFYYMGFYDIPNKETVSQISVAVVTQGDMLNTTENEELNHTEGKTESITNDKLESNVESNMVSALLSTFNSVKMKNGMKLFSTKEVSLSEAKELLDKDEIAAYIVCEDTPVLFVKNNGLAQSIVKSTLDSFVLHGKIADNFMNSNLDSQVIDSTAETIVDKNLGNQGTGYNNFIVDVSNSKNFPGNTLIYFYSLIAFACIYGSKLGFREMSAIRADQTSLGVRIHVSPISKFKLLLCHLIAAFSLQYLSIIFLLTFLIKILRIKFGGHLWMLLLTCFMGTLCGITLGAMICVVIKANVRVRSGVLNTIILIGWFLSGMAIVGIKYYLIEYLPIISLINPFSLITDAFYYLYFYDGYALFFMNINFLLALSAIFGIVSYLEIRRKEYASI
jgi:ABC-2 type transport system permease protein